MVIIEHTLVHFPEVYDKTQFVRVRLFHGENWAVVQARIVVFLNCSYAEELIYFLVDECLICCQYGKLLYIGRFLCLRAENMVYCGRSSHIKI